jgi:hypothetical protein
MNKRGIMALELIVAICSIIGSVGGLYLGWFDTPAAEPEKIIVIDMAGHPQETMALPGHSYDVEVTADKKLIIKEKK